MDLFLFGEFWFSCELILACEGFIECLCQLVVLWWLVGVISDGCMGVWGSRLWWFCNGNGWHPVVVSDF